MKTIKSGMTPRERMLATFAGQPVDYFPVHAPYLMLLHADHWVKITGKPPQEYYRWCLQEPEEHILEYQNFHNLLPFDISQPEYYVPPAEVRRRRDIVPDEDGESWYMLDRGTGTRTKLVLNLHEKDQNSEWERVVFNKDDAERLIPIQKATDMLSQGMLDHVKAYVRAFGDTRFVAGTVVNAFYMSSWSVGLTNRFLLVHDEPELLHAVIERYHQRNIETVRAMKAAGTDMVFIDDATATNDMISIPMYREFSLPYLKRLVDEVKNLGMKSVVIYFGGMADRVEEIVSSGADGLQMETSMKSFVNDLEDIANKVNNRMLMFGNINPYDEVQSLNDDDLKIIIENQISIGKKYGRFVSCTGSPLTPNTTLERMQTFIRLAHQLSAA